MTGKNVLLIILLVLIIGSGAFSVLGVFAVNSWLTPGEEWSKIHSGPPDQISSYGGTLDLYTYSATQTSDGGYLLAGVEGHIWSNGPPYVGAWVVKTDSSGSMQWNKTFGENVNGYPHAIQQTLDGGYVLAGETGWIPGNGDFWLVKLDASGNIQWNRTYGGINTDRAYSLCQSPDGGFVIVGYTYSYGNEDIWLVKVDQGGKMQWNETFRGTDGYYSCVRRTSDGGYIVGGNTAWQGPNKGYALLVKIDPGGNVQWNKTYGAGSERLQSIEQTIDGGYIFAGYTRTHTVGSDDFWLVKVDSNGTMQWSRNYGTEANDEANYVQQTSDGGYIVGGDSLSLIGRAWLVRTDSKGDMLWNKALGDDNGYGSYYPVLVQQTSDGQYFIAGTAYYSGVDDGHYGIWFAEVAGAPSLTSVTLFTVWSLVTLFAIVASFGLIDMKMKRDEKKDNP